MSLINPKLLHKIHTQKSKTYIHTYQWKHTYIHTSGNIHTYIPVETTFDIEHSALSWPEEVKELAAFHARYMHTTSLKYLQHI